MKKNFIAIIKNILKNKNIPKYCFEIIEKDGSTCFLSTNYFDVINFEILNTRPSRGTSTGWWPPGLRDGPSTRTAPPSTTLRTCAPPC